MDRFTPEIRSKIMSRVKAKESKIEQLLRKSLSRKGYRFRKNSTRHFGKPDIVFVSKKLVIFVDSCFWHGCKTHFRAPAQNKVFWKKKIERNIERDKEVTRYYKKIKWNVIRVWEHELKKNIARSISRIEVALAK